MNKSGKSAQIKVDLKFNTNNLNVIRQAALAGLGLARLPVSLCEAELRDHRLVLPLPAWSPPHHHNLHSLPVPALAHPRRQTVRVRARQTFASEASWAPNRIPF